MYTTQQLEVLKNTLSAAIATPGKYNQNWNMYSETSWQKTLLERIRTAKKAKNSTEHAHSTEHAQLLSQYWACPVVEFR